MKKPRKNFLDREGNYIYVGDYWLAGEKLTLFGEVGESGGSVVKGVKLIHSKEHEAAARIVVGLNQPRWWRALDVLLHEATEFAFLQLNVRYKKVDFFNDTTAGYSFMMDHEQFAEAIVRVAEFLAPAMPDLFRVWQKAKRLKLTPI